MSPPRKTSHRAPDPDAARPPALADLCEPFIAAVMRINRDARSNRNQRPFNEVNLELRGLLREAGVASNAHPVCRRSWLIVAPALEYFADEIISRGCWVHRDRWRREALSGDLAHERPGDEGFWQLFSDALAGSDEASRQAVEVMYTLVALGFSGKLRGDPEALSDWLERAYDAIPEERKAPAVGPMCPGADTPDDRIVERDIQTPLLIVAALGACAVVAAWVTVGFLADDGLRRAEEAVANLSGAAGLARQSTAMFLLSSFLRLLLAAVPIGLCWWLLRILRARHEKFWSRLHRDLTAGGAAAKRTGERLEQERLNDLATKFQQGLERFRDAGKSLYFRPWYILIGDSATGKSMAIDKSIGPGMANPGARPADRGRRGTLNIDWWFPRKGVVVDPAGWLFGAKTALSGTRNAPEDNPAKEWRYLLSLLRKHRRRQPINGALLVINMAPPPPPARGQDPDPRIKSAPPGLLFESLTDAEARARRYRLRLDEIHEVCGIHYPVWVLITLCDRVAGFREFFCDLPVSALAQTIGWSRAGEPDTEYQPEELDRGIEDLLRQLRRKRLTLLKRPDRLGDPENERTDTFDDLFLLPSELALSLPKLHAYLRAIFTQDPKTGFAPMLRGVYFSSALERGRTFIWDQSQRPEQGTEPAPAEERDRAMFLQRLIHEKVFGEKGLVSTSRRLVRRRLTLTAVIAAAGALALGLALWAAFVHLKPAFDEFDRRFQVSTLITLDSESERFKKPVFSESNNRLAADQDLIKPLARLLEPTDGKKPAVPALLEFGYQSLTGRTQRLLDNRESVIEQFVKENAFKALADAINQRLEKQPPTDDQSRRKWAENFAAPLLAASRIAAAGPHHPSARRQDWIDLAEAAFAETDGLAADTDAGRAVRADWAKIIDATKEKITLESQSLFNAEALASRLNEAADAVDPKAAVNNARSLLDIRESALEALRKPVADAASLDASNMIEGLITKAASAHQATSKETLAVDSVTTTTARALLTDESVRDRVRRLASLRDELRSAASSRDAVPSAKAAEDALTPLRELPKPSDTLEADPRVAEARVLINHAKNLREALSATDGSTALPARLSAAVKAAGQINALAPPNTQADWPTRLRADALFRAADAALPTRDSAPSLTGLNADDLHVLADALDPLRSIIDRASDTTREGLNDRHARLRRALKEHVSGIIKGITSEASQLPTQAAGDSFDINTFLKELENLRYRANGITPALSKLQIKPQTWPPLVIAPKEDERAALELVPLSPPDADPFEAAQKLLKWIEDHSGSGSGASDHVVDHAARLLAAQRLQSLPNRLTRAIAQRLSGALPAGADRRFPFTPRGASLNDADQAIGSVLAAVREIGARAESLRSASRSARSAFETPAADQVGGLPDLRTATEAITKALSGLDSLNSLERSIPSFRDSLKSMEGGIDALIEVNPREKDWTWSWNRPRAEGAKSIEPARINQVGGKDEQPRSLLIPGSTFDADDIIQLDFVLTAERRQREKTLIQTGSASPSTPAPDTFPDLYLAALAADPDGRNTPFGKINLTLPMTIKGIKARPGQTVLLRLVLKPTSEPTGTSAWPTLPDPTAPPDAPADQPPP